MKKHQGDLSTYRAAFLECRPGVSGHSWKWLNDFKIVRNRSGSISEFSRLRRCTRCKSESVKVYDGTTGHVLRRSYTYVDNYMIDATKFKSEPGQAVLESLRRALESGRAEEVDDGD